MAKILIVDLSGERITAGVFSSVGREPKSFWILQATGDLRVDVSRLCAELTSSGYGRFSTVVIGLPVNVVSLRVIELALEDKDKTLDVIPFETKDLFLKPSVELVYGISLLTGNKKIVAAVDKSVLREHIDAFKTAKISPTVISLSMFSRHRLLKKKAFSGDCAFIDKSTFTALRGGKPLMYKHLNSEVDLSLAIATCESEGITISHFFASYEGLKILKAIGMEGEIVSGYDEQMAGIDSLYLSLQEEGIAGIFNLRAGESVESDTDVSLERLSRMTMMLSVVFIATSIVYTAIKQLSITAGIKAVSTELEKQYKDVFPGETKIADPLYLMEAKLKALKTEGMALSDGVDAAGVMITLSEAARDIGGLKVVALEISPGKLTAVCEMSTYEKASLFGKALQNQALFTQVKVLETTQTPSGEIMFNLAATFRGFL